MGKVRIHISVKCAKKKFIVKFLISRDVEGLIISIYEIN